MSEPAVEDRPALNVSVEDTGPARKKLSIEIPEERILEKLEEMYGKLEEEAAIPGFRKGRAPRRLLERRFGDAIRDDAQGQLLSEAFTQAVEEQELNVIGEPDIKDLETLNLPDSGALSFEVEVEVTPDFELPSLDGIAVNRPKIEPSESEVDEEIERLRDRYGRMEAQPDATIEADDFAICDVRIFEGHHGQAGVPEGAEPLHEDPDTHLFVAGESRDFRGHVAGIVVDDLGKRAMGRTAGDRLTIETTGPESHEVETLRDKPITVQVELKEIQRVTAAPMDTLLQMGGFEDEESFRGHVRDSLEQRATARQRREMRYQVEQYFLDHASMDLPEGLSGRQTERLLQRRRYELMYQGLSEEAIEEQLAEMRSETAEQATRELKLYFLLEKAAEQLEVEVGEGEINGQLASMALQRGQRPEKLRQEMAQSGELEYLHLQIREQKTIDAILEKAEITDVEPQSNGAPRSASDGGVEPGGVEDDGVEAGGLNEDSGDRAEASGHGGGGQESDASEERAG